MHRYYKGFRVSIQSSPRDQSQWKPQVVVLNLKEARPDRQGMILAPKGDWTAPTEELADQRGFALATEWIDAL